jgi:UDP-glucose 4-epimerase
VVPHKRPKVFVTGGAGFIGSHVVDQLIANGYKTVVIDNLSTGLVENVNPRAIFYKADIRDPEISRIFEEEKPDYIIHYAAQVCESSSPDQVVNDSEVNMLGTVNLLEHACRNKIKLFIFPSPGLELYGEPSYLPCDENHPVQPISQYGVCKQAIEQILNLYHENYGLNSIIFRYPHIYGPRQCSNDGKSPILPLIHEMLSGVHMIVSQQNDLREDYVYVKDCAWATLLCLEREPATGIYNLGAGHSIPTNTIITILKELINYPYTPVMPFMSENITREIYLDNRKIRRDFGWYPRVDLLEGLERTIEFTTSHLKNWENRSNSNNECELWNKPMKNGRFVNHWFTYKNQQEMAKVAHVLTIAKN